MKGFYNIYFSSTPPENKHVLWLKPLKGEKKYELLYFGNGSWQSIGDDSEAVEALGEKLSNEVFASVSYDETSRIITFYNINGESVGTINADKIISGGALDLALAYAYGVERTIGQTDPSWDRIGNTTYHKNLPLQSGWRFCVAQGTDIQYYLNDDDKNFKESYSSSEMFNLSTYSAVIYDTDVETAFGSSTVYCPRVFGVDAITDDKVSCYITLTGISIPSRIQRLIDDVSNHLVGNDGSYDAAWLNRPVPVAITSDGETLTAKGVICDYTDDVLTIFFPDTYHDTLDEIVSDSDEIGNYYFVFGASLDGYDGAVRADVPTMYFWSEVTDTKQRVFMSPIKLGDDWIKSPRMLVDAWRPTVLNTALNDEDSYGWLGTLSAKSLVSVVNYNTWCRGGSNSSNYDTYLDSSYLDPENAFKTLLGKPRTSLSRATFRTYCKNTGDGSQLISYNNYKWLFFWSWVIEYATTYSQNTYNEELTSEGYHQGGMGTGVTSLSESTWSSFNSSNPITPCGFLNTLGNSTGVVSITTDTLGTLSIPCWRGFDNNFGDIWTNVDGCNFYYDKDLAANVLYTTDDASLYNDSSIDGFDLVATTSIKSYCYPLDLFIGSAGIILGITSGGSSTKGLTDYFYVGSYSSFRRCMFGGGAHSGSRAGLGYLYGDYAVSASYSYVGSRSLLILE